MKKPIIVTGACGFIGYNIAKFLSDAGHELILVDRNKRDDMVQTPHNAKYIDAEELLSGEQVKNSSVVVHMGASVNTGDTDRAAVMSNNFEYSKQLFDMCASAGTRLIYASSAATYGDGSRGFDDTRRDLKPQNYYAESKHLFDEYVRDASKKPPQSVGLKFFNVYGPHESHKGRMASSVFFAYEQAKKSGVITLFRSHNPHYDNGEQARDFVYVADVVSVVNFFIEHGNLSGIFNVGTGTARTFKDLALSVFSALGKEPKIEFIDTPEQFRAQYQYFTQANIERLRDAGYSLPFRTIEDGVREYVQYLEKNI